MLVLLCNYYANYSTKYAKCSGIRTDNRAAAPATIAPTIHSALLIGYCWTLHLYNTIELPKYTVISFLDIISVKPLKPILATLSLAPSSQTSQGSQGADVYTCFEVCCGLEPGAHCHQNGFRKTTETELIFWI